MSSPKISTPKLAVPSSMTERVKGSEPRSARTSTSKTARPQVTDGFVPPRPAGKGVDRASSSYLPVPSAAGKAPGGVTGPKKATPKLSLELMETIKKAAVDISSRFDVNDKKGQSGAISDFVKSLGLGKLESRLVKWVTTTAVRACYASGSGSSGTKPFDNG